MNAISDTTMLIEGLPVAVRGAEVFASQEWRLGDHGADRGLSVAVLGAKVFGWHERRVCHYDADGTPPFGGPWCCGVAVG